MRFFSAGYFAKYLVEGFIKVWTNKIQFMLAVVCVYEVAKNLSDFIVLKEAVVVSIFAIFIFGHTGIEKAYVLALLY